MISTTNNDFRQRRYSGPQGRDARPGRRDGAPVRERGSRREHATVVHPWMSLPGRLAAAQAEMRELAGAVAFDCPLGEALAMVPARVPEAANEAKPRVASVNIVVRKRRLPADMIAALASAH